jgi:hypothetical protein
VAKVTSQRKSRTTITRAQDLTIGQDSELEEMVKGDADGVKTALLPAYRTYLEGRKGLAQAFKEREYRDQEAYKDVERRYHLCQEAIDKAVRMREKAELDASDTYREDVDRVFDKASQSYKDKTRQALIECKQKVMDAWRSSTEASGEMTGVCEEEIEKAMRAREKVDMDALHAYRQDVDRAVDRASQAYHERVNQALLECTQKVVEAWRSSMETSARMAGIFEEDRHTSQEDEPVGKRSDPQTLQFREAMRRARSGFLSMVARARRSLEAGHPT